MKLNKFKNKIELEKELCLAMIKAVQQAITEHGNARILLSGGSTPLDLYAQFGSSKIDISRVQIGLVDERYVAFSSDYNNQRKIEEALNNSKTSQFKLAPMVVDVTNRIENLSKVKELYQPFFERIDFCLLGMGEDGHTASLFPRDPASSLLLTQKENDIDYTEAPGFPTDRISCNKKMLLNAKNVALMIIGDKKLSILNSSKENYLPIAQFMENEINVYFTQK